MAKAVMPMRAFREKFGDLNGRGIRAACTSSSRSSSTKPLPSNGGGNRGSQELTHSPGGGAHPLAAALAVHTRPTSEQQDPASSAFGRRSGFDCPLESDRPPYIGAVDAAHPRARPDDPRDSNGLGHDRAGRDRARGRTARSAGFCCARSRSRPDGWNAIESAARTAASRGFARAPGSARAGKNPIVDWNPAAEPPPPGR